MKNRKIWKIFFPLFVGHLINVNLALAVIYPNQRLDPRYLGPIFDVNIDASAGPNIDDKNFSQNNDGENIGENSGENIAANNGENTDNGPMPDTIYYELPQPQQISDSDMDCGISSMGLPTRRILNGKDVIDGDWPWAVYLSSGCTGSIVSSRHVLSAAHCAFEDTRNGTRRLSSGTVVIGRDRNVARSVHDLRLQMAKIFVHPQYDFHDFASPDIAIFELAKNVTFSQKAQKICLPADYREYYGQIAVIVGWGADNRTDKSNKAQFAQETMIPLNAPEDCDKHFKNISYGIDFNEKEFICGGGTLRGTEGGDSGGPLMVNERGRWFQVGITSFGEMGKSPRGYYDVGAYLRVAEHCDWILRVTNGEVKCLDMYKFPHRMRH